MIASKEVKKGNMTPNILINRKERKRFKAMSQILVHQNQILDELKENSQEFYSLNHILSQKMLKIDKIQTFTYVSLSKRLADHSFFHCGICNETYDNALRLNQHRFSTKCWNNQEQLQEVKQKIYLCRICDKVYTDYKAMIIHIVTELILSGYTIPCNNLDLSQCITILYIEQICSENLSSTIAKIKSFTVDAPEDIFDEIDKLEAEIDDEDGSKTADTQDTLEIVIDLGDKDQEKSVTKSVQNTSETPQQKLMMSMSVNEFRSNAKSMAVGSSNDGIKIISMSPSPTKGKSSNNLKRKSSQDVPLMQQSNSSKIRIVDVGSAHIDVQRESIKDQTPEQNPMTSTQTKISTARGTLTTALKSKNALERAMIRAKQAKVLKSVRKTVQPIKIKKESPDGLINEASAVKAVEALKMTAIVDRVTTPPPEALSKRQKSKAAREVFITAQPSPTKVALKGKNLPPPREESKRKRTPKRKFAIEETIDPADVSSDDEKDTEERRYSLDEKSFVQEPIVQPMIPNKPLETSESKENQKVRIKQENELIDKLGTVVKSPEEKNKSILAKAKVEIDRLNKISAELQRALHMEKARNQQLKKQLENEEKAMQPPPIKMKIQHGKALLQSEC